MGKIRYKIDVLSELKQNGYSAYRLGPKGEKIFGDSTIQTIRRGNVVSVANLATICELLNCQPGDILEYVEDEPVKGAVISQTAYTPEKC